MTDKFEDRLEGIPQWLNKVERLVSDNVSKYNKFTIKFEKATENKKNLDDILKPFLVYLLEGTLKMFDHKKFKDVKDSIDHIIRLLKKENVTEEELKSAIHAAADVAWATNVAAAAWAATWAATWAAAVLSGWADAAARAAAVLSDRADATAYAAAWVTRADFYDDLADKLLELIRGAKY